MWLLLPSVLFRLELRCSHLRVQFYGFVYRMSLLFRCVTVFDVFICYIRCVLLDGRPLCLFVVVAVTFKGAHCNTNLYTWRWPIMPKHVLYFYNEEKGEQLKLKSCSWTLSNGQAREDATEGLCAKKTYSHGTDKLYQQTDGMATNSFFPVTINMHVGPNTLV
jgi:hypothetical protein